MDLLSRLPEHFEFYDQGEVGQALRSLSDSPSGETVLPLAPESTADKFGIMILIQGDIKGVLIALFDNGLDNSMYSEMVNVIASRLADRLSAEDEVDVVISPPKVLDTESLERTLTQVLKDQKLVTRGTYIHLNRGNSVRFETLIYV